MDFTILFENDEGYFVATKYCNGNPYICIGLVDFNRYDFPSHHPFYELVKNCTPETVEEIYNQIFTHYEINGNYRSWK